MLNEIRLVAFSQGFAMGMLTFLAAVAVAKLF